MHLTVIEKRNHPLNKHLRDVMFCLIKHLFKFPYWETLKTDRYVCEKCKYECKYEIKINNCRESKIGLNFGFYYRKIQMEKWSNRKINFLQHNFWRTSFKNKFSNFVLLDIFIHSIVSLLATIWLYSLYLNQSITIITVGNL